MFFLPPPVILVQPAPRMQYAGESATFSVVLQTPGASFQWRRNGVAIPGATAFLYVTPPLTPADDREVLDVVVTEGGEAVTSKPAPVRVGPFPTSYVTAKGEKLALFAWPGKKVAYLTQSSELSAPVMRNLLATTDELWDYYASATGQTPHAAQTYEGLAVIAQTDSEASAASRSQLSYAEMRSIYTAQAKSEADHALFEWLDRNFRSYEPQLAYKGPDSDRCVMQGLANVLEARARLQLAAHPNYDESSYGRNASPVRLKPLIEIYAADPALNWQNTFRTDTFSAVPGADCAGLFVSMMDTLIAQHGGEAFLHSFLRQAATQTPAKTTQQAVDNFVLAASAAAQTDLVPLFKTQWRWPVSLRQGWVGSPNRR